MTAITQTYSLKGMHCTSCESEVQKSLLASKAVNKVSVLLDKEQVTIVFLKEPLSLEALQILLPKKYTINRLASTNKGVSSLSKFRQLRPLFLILSYLFVAAFLLNYKKDLWPYAMWDYMGLFFIVFSFFKLLDYKNFPTSFRRYDPIAKKIPFYAWMYPFLETVLGILFLMRLELHIALYTTLVVIGVTTIGVVRVLFLKKQIECACLGTVLKLPMTEATFIENAIMLFMASYMLFAI